MHGGNQVAVHHTTHARAQFVEPRQSAPLGSAGRATRTLELVQRCRAGEEAAWRELITLFTPVVWTVARSMGLRHAECEDTCQLTWLRVVENLSSLREPERLGSWLVTTARREAIKVLARSRRLLPIDDVTTLATTTDPQPSPEETAVSRAENHRLLSAVSRLPPAHQALVGLLLADPPMSYDEISDALAMPRGSVGPTRLRILRRLRTELGR
jgi:RNA polymerase sigma factor (sigma-70 family)